jgi:hypothetical protein
MNNKRTNSTQRCNLPVREEDEVKLNIGIQHRRMKDEKYAEWTR